MRNLMLTTALIALGLPALADDAALLIGVERYQDLRRLSGGADVTRADGDLRDAGYVVAALTNGSARDTQRVLGDFMAEVGDADRLVVGLSGRFVTDGPRTWFLTADAGQPDLFAMGSTAVSLDSLMAVMARVPGQAVLVLGLDSGASSAQGDYLREGLGELDIPQGVTVLIAPPNQTDDILSDAVARPGVNIMAYVQDNRRLAARGYVPQRLILQPDDTAEGPAPVIDPTRPFWEQAQKTNTADSYRNFLFAYPNSPYAAEARRRLDDIESNPVRLAEQGEAALNLSRNERRDIQRNLTLLDYNTRGVDGIFGPGTRGAIRNWQQTNGFAQTGYLNAEQISRIDAQASRRAAEIEAEEAEARATAERLDRAFWEETGARGDEAGYRIYLDRYPEGLFAEEARAALNQSQEEEQEQGSDLARAEEEALNINPVLARLIESRLDQLGFNPGRVDGQFDSDTRSAIARYQTRRNLPATGYLNQPTLARLLADTLGR